MTDPAQLTVNPDVAGSILRDLGDGILIHVDEAGHVAGVTCTSGPVTVETLAAVLRYITTASARPDYAGAELDEISAMVEDSELLPPANPTDTVADRVRELVELCGRVLGEATW